jgi:hypothetical protein
MQWRYHNPNNFSMGFSMQIDAGERIRHPKDFIQKFHLRTGDFKRIDQIVVGRYSIQLGQGLVQGGLSGYWNAPIVWARKTPDWQLAEKRGWDEYRGHSGLGISGKLPKNGLKWMVCASRENISARVTENGKISSLITDGNFSTARQLSQQYNTLQSHATVAVLTPKGLGFGLSGYRYNREWAKEKMGAYPEVWFTHYHQNGDMQFGHLALQYNLPAMVWGYVRPINKTTDLSVRTYWIHRDFKPPQGLFNQFNNNQWRVAAMYSQGNAGKKLWRWGVEMGKDIKHNPSNGVRRFHHKQQFHWERALFSGVRWQGDWQAPTTYDAQIKLQNLNLPPRPLSGPAKQDRLPWPGVRGADTQITLNQDGGQIEVSLRQDGAVFLPGILEEAEVRVQALSAKAVFKREAQQWRVPEWKLQLSNAYLQGEWQGQWTHPSTWPLAKWSRHPHATPMRAPHPG